MPVVQRFGRYRRKLIREKEITMDILLLIGILLLLLALLGFGGVLGALKSIAWLLLILAVIVIAWRIITGRRPV